MLERWLRIELRHLFALEAVAEEGSFSAAGDRLGYVQSAVSHQIAALESIVGKRLVERSRGTKPVALTTDGQALYQHAKTILARVRAAEADLADDGDACTLRVATFQMISSRIVSRVLQRLEGEVCVELVERTTEVGLLDRLAAGELDAVFTEGPLGPGPVRLGDTVRRSLRARRASVVPYRRRKGHRSRCTSWCACRSSAIRTNARGSNATSQREVSGPTTSSAPTSTRRSRRSSGTASRTPSCRASRSTRPTRDSP